MPWQTDVVASLCWPPLCGGARLDRIQTGDKGRPPPLSSRLPSVASLVRERVLDVARIGGGQTVLCAQDPVRPGGGLFG